MFKDLCLICNEIEKNGQTINIKHTEDFRFHYISLNKLRDLNFSLNHLIKTKKTWDIFNNKYSQQHLLLLILTPSNS